MLFRIRRALLEGSVVAGVIVLALSLAGSANAAGSGQPGTSGLISPFPGFSAFASPAVLARNHESAFGSFTGESPQALTVDQATGDVYVVDPAGKELWRYSAGGAPVDFTAGADAGTNALTGISFQSSSPSLDEVAVDDSGDPAKGDIYVTTSGAGHVEVFASSGESLGTLTGTGTPSGGLGEDCGVAVDESDGDLYVADRQNHIWRYSPSGAMVAETDYSGGIETSIEPCQIAVANGNVYAKDWEEFPVLGAGPLNAYPTSSFASGSPSLVSGTQVASRASAVATDPATGDVYADEDSKVTVYDPAGATLYSYGKGEIGSFSAGIAVASGGDSYVSDQTNHQVHIYGATLEAGSRADLGAFGSFTGESPQAITVDQATGDVYVVDPAGKKLWRYSASGAPVDFTAGPDAGTNALSGLGFQSSSPSLDEVAVDDSGGPAKGDIYVTSGSSQVDVFASSGELLGSLTGAGTPSGSLGEDCGVAVDESDGDLYVADRQNHVWRYSPSHAVVAEADYSGGIETSIEPCQIAVANGNLYAKGWQEFPVEGAGPVDSYAISAFVTGAPPSVSGTQILARATGISTDPASGDLYADERNKITVYAPSGATLYNFAAGEIGNTSTGVAIKTSGGDAYAADSANHQVRIYGPFSAPPPLLEAKSPTGVGHVKVTMNAHLDPNNSLSITSCAFEWGTDTNYSETPVACEQGGAYTTPANVSAQLTGLTPGTTYHYRLHVTTSNGGFESQDQSFETIPASSTPEVSTRKATALSSTSAELKGAVDANANPLTGCHFEYVTDVAFAATGFSDLSSGGSVPCSPAYGSIPVDYEDHEVAATVTGLDTEQIYRFRLIAENSNGAGESESALIPGAPLVETTGSPTRTTTTARFGSRINPHGDSTNYWFEYVTDAQFQAGGFADATSTPHELLAADEVQKVIVAPSEKYEDDLNTSHFSGQFTCSFGGYTTSPLSAPVLNTEFKNASLSTELQTALSALPSIGAGNVHVDSGNGGSAEILYVVTFQGTLGNADVEELVCSSVSTQPVRTVEVKTVIQGGPTDRIILASAPVQGLQPGTTYHYRVSADNGTPGGVVVGTDQTLTTRSSEAPLSHGHYPGPPGSDRAWEQVSVPDTNGNAVEIPDISDNGERVVYGIDGGSPGSTYGGETFNNSNNQFAERSAQGWRRHQLYPTRAQAPGNIWTGPWGNAELTILYAANYDETHSGDAGVFRMSPDQPSQQLFSRPGEIGNEFFTSEDGSRLIGVLPGTADPDYPLAEQQHELYDLSSGTPQLIGLLPDGSVPSCGVSAEYMGGEGGNLPPARNQVTPDGSHVFFNTYVGSYCAGDEHLDLFDRDLVNSKTTLIAPEGRFIRYTAGYVFFDTTESLIPSDHGGSDIYRYNVSDGSISCITCATPAAGDVETDGNSHGDYRVIAVSDDGSRVYFTAVKSVLPGAATRGIYRVNVASGELAYVAPSYGTTFETKATEDPAEGDALSPNGRFLVFRSDSMELNAVDGQQNAATAQYYLYDDQDRSLVCASCAPDGTPPRGEVPNQIVVSFSRYLHNADVVTDSGDLAFTTPTALVPSDQNTARPQQEAARGDDIYEWRDGRLLLVTDGKTESGGEGTGPLLAGVAANGRDVFFTQAAALTPDAIDSSRHLYDARIGGGFDFPVPPAPCSLEACQGTPLPPPDDATPASLSFSGPGNQPAAEPKPKSCTGAGCSKKKSRSQKRCAKGKTRKRGKCVKKAQRSRAKKANHNKGGAK